ncbi:MFS general substrate transporter [Calocera viscosa TUFC12733]|uniref:MFS general substrate transporter n=1 Tax=Calocera viscosa (strain TUFC12733) TaxID=1330018 RepID=A0A167MHB3_CALVF|nr:MFS general substrate transporter [Calocera viscosa TUFC12733]
MTRHSTKDVDEEEGSERAPFLDNGDRVVDRDDGAGDEFLTTQDTTPAWKKPSIHWLAPFALFAAICRGMTLAPRVEVYTALTCLALKPQAVFPNASVPVDSFAARSLSYSFDVFPPLYIRAIEDFADYSASDPTSSADEEVEVPVDTDPSQLPEPTKACSKSPDVQSSAARLQTAISITMGLLSALTTPYWGTLADSIGRTRVLTFCALGLLVTDVVFLLVCRFRFSMSRWVLVMGPIVEGLMGGWTAMQAAINAYASDAINPQDRVKIFSRFFGLIYIGVALGPVISGFLVKMTDNLISVFYLSASSWLLLALLFATALPESLSQETMTKKRHEREAKRLAHKGSWLNFAAPLIIFVPRKRVGRLRRDWNVTMIGMAAFCMLLVYGIYHMKFAYAIFVYAWGSEQLGYYLAYIGAARAVHLLILLPAIIRLIRHYYPSSTTSNSLPTDHRMATCSVALDVLAYTLTSISPPSAMWAFVIFTSMSSFAGGALPSMHSLALGILTAQEKEAAEAAGDDGSAGEVNHAGKLFGAFGLVQATSQILLGPLMFGALYSVTVYSFPKAIFVVAACLLVTSFLCLTAVRLSEEDKHRAEEAAIERERERGTGHH